MNNIAKELLHPGSLGGLTIQKVEERPPYVNLLVYGESGLGKTTLMGSADAVPSMRKVLVVDVEGGTYSLRRSYPNVDTVRVTNWKEMQNVYNGLYAGGHGYETVVLDSLTEIQKLNMYFVLEEMKKDPNNSDRDEDLASMREWGKNLEMMRKFIRAFRDLPVNSLFTALVRIDKNPKNGKELKKPGLTGKLAGEAAAYLDLVFFMYMKDLGEQEGGVQRMLLTGSTDDIVAKDRSGLMPLILKNPDMKSITDIMNTTPAKE